MKLPFIGLCVASAAALLLGAGTMAPFSTAEAQEAGCIKTDIAMHEKRCPTDAVMADVATPDVATPDVATAESSGEDVVADDTEPVEPAVTPTASPAEGCIKTEILMHERRCPDGV